MTKNIDESTMSQLLAQARIDPRKRSHLNFHRSTEAPVQRLLIGMCKGTYVRPHRHTSDTQWEFIVALKGEIIFLTFDDQGKVLERYRLAPGSLQSGLEIPAKTWHTLVPVDDHAVILEIKQGPYDPNVKAQFANWAPQEGEANTEQFNQWYLVAEPGDRFE